MLHIDPNVANDLLSIGLNVASDGLSYLIGKSGRKVEELIVGEEFLRKQDARTALEPLLQKSLADIAERIPWGAEKGVEIVSLFLKTREVEEIVRQLYSIKYRAAENRTENQDNLSAIRRAFLAFLAQYFAEYSPEYAPEPEQLSTCASSLFELLVEECNLLFDAAINDGTLAAHEAKENLRYKMLSGQVEAIHKILRLLSDSHKIDRRAILEYEQLYRKQVGAACSHITPPNLDSAIRRSIDDLYIYPRFSDKTRISNNITLKEEEFLTSISRTVLLGNPGAGKSTLTLKICYDLARHYPQRVLASRKELTPILVVLRNYGLEKKDRKCSILEYIETEAKTRYQLTVPPYQAFQYLLLTGRAVVIFDGLDELLDTSYRLEIRDDVEAFCRLYPSVPVLVTSREIGYDQAPLNESMFQKFGLAPFDDNQVEQYVYKWFSVADEENLTEKQHRAKAKAFLLASKAIKDLRSNPLMLALLCTIYRKESDVPRYRPDVYEKCAVLLFERWDQSRKLYAPPIPEELVRPLMEYLAHWIYNDEYLRGAGVTEEKLATETAKYLHEFLSKLKAQKSAGEFIQFCKGRAWVFTDTGTQRTGASLYQFTHLTFLEYFTASYLVSTHPKPEELLPVLIPRIEKREWDVVAQLSFQIQSRRNAGDWASDKLLGALLPQSLVDMSDRGYNLLSFAVRCLQFILPRTVVSRSITDAIVEHCFVWWWQHPSSGSTEGTEHRLIEMVNALLAPANENKTTIVERLEELLLERMKSKQRVEEIVITLEFVLYLDAVDSKTRWIELLDTFLCSHADQMEVLYPKSCFLCYRAVWRQRASISDLITHHGIAGLMFSGVPIKNPSPLPFPSLFFGLIEALFVKLPKTESKEYRFYQKSLEDVGNVLPHYLTPWLQYDQAPYLYLSELEPIFRQNISPLHVPFTNDVLFGIFILMALWLDIDDSQGGRSRGSIMTIVQKRFGQLHNVFLARYQSMNTLQKQLDHYGFTSEQQDFIRRWVRQKIHLVEKRKS